MGMRRYSRHKFTNKAFQFGKCKHAHRTNSMPKRRSDKNCASIQTLPQRAHQIRLTCMSVQFVSLYNLYLSVCIAKEVRSLYSGLFLDVNSC